MLTEFMTISSEDSRVKSSGLKFLQGDERGTSSFAHAQPEIVVGKRVVQGQDEVDEELSSGKLVHTSKG